MKITHHGIYFGADPEFFFTKKDKVIGAEKVLPTEGLFMLDWEQKSFGTPIVIIDGVQAELNVNPNSCRQLFSRDMGVAFKRLNDYMKTQKGVKISFEQTITVDKKEMDSLSVKAQQFGCAPSFNAYGPSTMSMQDASKYYYRSAGGHIHIGVIDSDQAKAFKNPDPIIRMLDVIVGNTCVLLDRSEGNAIRRTVYGKAGEYRTPKHGLEYRVLSNFWLRHYTIMSFVFGLTRFALSVAMDKKVSKAILEKVDFTKIQKAINDNDFDLAYENFNKIKDIIADIKIKDYDSESLYYPLEGERMEEFEKFIAEGIDKHFKEDPFKHWISNNLGTSGIGWENFIDNTSFKTKKARKAIAVTNSKTV